MKSSRKPLSIIIAITLCVVVICFLYATNLIAGAQNSLYEEKVNYLNEISVKSAYNVNEKIGGRLVSVITSSVYISQDEFTREYYLQALKNEQFVNSFKRMGIVLNGGATHTTDGAIVNVIGRDYYEKALAGNYVVSDLLTDYVDGKKIIVFAAPIYSKGLIEGVVFGVEDHDKFLESLSLESFGGAGRSHVVNSNGDYVISVENESYKENGNFFKHLAEQSNVTYNDIRNLKNDLSNNKNGTYEFDLDDKTQQVSYTAVGINNWFLLSIVPAEAVSANSRQLVKSISTILMFITFILVFSCGIILFLMDKNKKELEQIAYVDSITNCPNWNKFKIDATRMLQRHQNRSYCVVAFDIDNFKVFNDIYGHEMGNSLLKYIAYVLKKSVGDGEAFSRSVPDYFNILLRYSSDEDVVAKVAKLSEDISKFSVEYNIKLAFGIKKVEPQENFSITTLCDRANISRILAKADPEKNYAFFQDENRQDILKAQEIENIMEFALDNEEFKVYLQPKVCLKTGKMCSAEALTRWHRSDSEILSPIEFVPIFEKNGFIRRLDFFVLDQVCKLLKRWENENNPLKNMTISINISRAHLSNSNLAEDMFNIVSMYKLPTKLIEIELTESAVFTDVNRMIEAMDSIKAYGFLISIDDFGSGYSSMSALKDIPADIIKIDKNFFDAKTRDRRSEKIIASMIRLIKSLGQEVVFEGVETQEQVDFLMKSDCDYVQGYFYSRPLSLDKFEQKVLEFNKGGCL